MYPTIAEDALVFVINQTEVTHVVTTIELLKKLAPKLKDTQSVSVRADTQQNKD